MRSLQGRQDACMQATPGHMNESHYWPALSAFLRKRYIYVANHAPRLSIIERTDISGLCQSTVRIISTVSAWRTFVGKVIWGQRMQEWSTEMCNWCDVYVRDCYFRFAGWDCYFRFAGFISVNCIVWEAHSGRSSRPCIPAGKFLGNKGIQFWCALWFIHSGKIF